MKPRSGLVTLWMKAGMLIYALFLESWGTAAFSFFLSLAAFNEMALSHHLL